MAPRDRGRYLIRASFVLTLGTIWLLDAGQILRFTPALFVALFCMSFGVEVVGISMVRERTRRSPP